MKRVYLSLLFVILFAPASQAAWSRAGLYGADVRAMVIDPSDPDVIYIGTSQGEVYVSTNGAKSWKAPRGGVPFPGYVVDNLVIDRSRRLWAASWGLWGGGVVAYSEDGGVNWTRRDSGLEEVSVRAIAVDPSDGDHMVVGGLTGVYRSRDAGRSWSKISEQVNVESLAIDPRAPDRIYVGTWRQAFRTDDGGKNWALVNNGMVLDTDVFAIEIDPKNPDNIWLSTCGWVYNSTNGGDTWVRFKEGFNNRRIHAVAIDPQDSNIVYAGSVAGLYRTPDLGKTWSVLSDEGLVINAIGLHRKRPNRIILATEGDGIYVSDDSGKTFNRFSDGLHNVRIAAVVPDPSHRGKVYASVLFGGSASGIYRSDDSGRTWARMNTTRLPQVLTLAVQKDTSPRFLAGTEQGFFWSEDGAEWTRAEPSVLPIRVDEILPYNRTRLFAATSEGVFTTRDGGKAWYRLAGSIDRITDLALGTVGVNRALYALTTTGLSVFDGSSWSKIENAPSKGQSIALGVTGDKEMIVVAGMNGVRSGWVDEARKWNELTAPKIAHGSALRSDVAVYLSSRETGRIYFADGDRWKSMETPLRLIDVEVIASDPFQRDRLYLGTGGQGLYIYSPGPGVAAQTAATSYSTGGSK
jgi:photosystem II stability/assembly factor-like uncharacterized protein